MEHRIVATICHTAMLDLNLMEAVFRDGTGLRTLRDEGIGM